MDNVTESLERINYYSNEIQNSIKFLSDKNLKDKMVKHINQSLIKIQKEVELLKSIFLN
jgi:hypothetical protein